MSEHTSRRTIKRYPTDEMVEAAFQSLFNDDRWLGTKGIPSRHAVRPALMAALARVSGVKGWAWCDHINDVEHEFWVEDCDGPHFELLIGPNLSTGHQPEGGAS